MRTTVMIILLTFACAAGAQTDFDDPVGVDSQATGAVADTTRSRTQAMLHFGWFERIGGTEVRREKGTFLFTGNLDFLKRPTGRSTWGIGLRVSADDDGHRWGARYIHRRLLPDSRKGYWQVAPGLTFSGDDNKRSLGLPGGFCEVEIGHETWGSLSLAVEVVRYEGYFIGSHYDHDLDDYVFVYDDKGTEVSWYLGAKAPGWKGVLIFTGLAVGVAVALENSGW